MTQQVSVLLKYERETKNAVVYQEVELAKTGSPKNVEPVDYQHQKVGTRYFQKRIFDGQQYPELITATYTFSYK